jgi:hypothetical protein
MSSFEVDFMRNGGWWMVHIPELGGLTQARFPGEVELTAREYIAVTTGTPLDQGLSTGVAARSDDRWPLQPLPGRGAQRG